MSLFNLVKNEIIAFDDVVTGKPPGTSNNQKLLNPYEHISSGFVFTAPRLSAIGPGHLLYNGDPDLYLLFLLLRALQSGKMTILLLLLIV
jgi:hypothetical protein